MSVRVMSAVFESKTLNPTERLIMLALADHSDDAGRCYPSNSRLCERTGLSERAVRTNIRALEAGGYLTVLVGAGQGGANVYHVHPDGGQQMPQAANAPGSKCRQGGQQMPVGGAADAPKPSLNHQEPSEEPPLVPQRRKRRMALPPDWVPSDRNLADAEARQFSAQEIDREAAAFRDHHLAKGNLFADWDAAWRTWLGNARKFAAGRVAGPTVAGGRGQSGSLASIAARRHLGRAAGFPS